MKAILLAAGKGSRLGVISDSLPKCLVPIGGVPLLLRWLNMLETAGIKEVLINTHHLPTQVNTVLKRWGGKSKLTIVQEDELLGTAATVGMARQFLEGTSDFFVIHCDNYAEISLGAMIKIHQERAFPITAALFDCEEPAECGIVTLNSQDLVIDLIEKSETVNSTLANAAIYIFRKEVLQVILDNKFKDISTELLPHYLGRIMGVKVCVANMDLGTVKRISNCVMETLCGNYRSFYS